MVTIGLEFWLKFWLKRPFHTWVTVEKRPQESYVETHELTLATSGKIAENRARTDG